MEDLGNKMNPFLAGLTGLGEGFLQGYLSRLKMNQEQQQIDFTQRRLSMLDLMNQRQNDLGNEFKRTDDLRQQQQNDKNNQQQDYNTFIIVGKDYHIKDQKEFVDGFDVNGNPIPKDAIPGDPQNPYLKGKILIPKTGKTPQPKTAIKTAEIPNMNGKKGYINLETGEFEKDAQGNLIIAGEESGGLSALSEHNIRKDKEEKQIKIDQAQQIYNDIMDSWDEKSKAYVVRRPNGSPLMFKDEKLLRQYATKEVLKTKPPGKINFWTREQKQAKEKIDIKLKYKDAFQVLKSKGYSEQEAIDLIKQNEGI